MDTVSKWKEEAPASYDEAKIAMLNRVKARMAETGHDDAHISMVDDMIAKTKTKADEPAYVSQDSNFVQIRREDLIRLVKASMKLEALEGGGVDNWVGYGEALFEDYGNGRIADEIKRPDFFDTYCKRYVVSD